MTTEEVYTKLGKCRCYKNGSSEAYVYLRLDCCTGWERHCRACGKRQEVHEDKPTPREAMN